MMVPVVGVLASALILGEPITATVVAAVALIFTGVSLNVGADRLLVQS
jgi:drug/metabolite transporter (DMT)-like permease